jgi:hypothetical protein
LVFWKIVCCGSAVLSPSCSRPPKPKEQQLHRERRFGFRWWLVVSFPSWFNRGELGLPGCENINRFPVNPTNS